MIHTHNQNAFGVRNFCDWSSADTDWQYDSSKIPFDHRSQTNPVRSLDANSEAMESHVTHANEHLSECVHANCVLSSSRLK